MDGAAETTIRSTCPYCGVGCGVLLHPDGQGGLSVSGDPDHPANHGKLCSKGSALGETMGVETRLAAPRVFGAGATWDAALDLVASRFAQTIKDHGPDSVAFYVSGQLLTEDYYVANKLMKGFIGSANIDTNSRLCMASSVAGHKRAFGTDTVPGTYEDLDEADLIVLTGSNLAWCHPIPYQRILKARKTRGTKIVVIDPRRTATCDVADLHLALDPGADVALFNRLLVEIAQRGATNAEYLKNTNGFDAALDAAKADASVPTGISEADLKTFCDMWIDTPRVVTIYSQGVNQSTSGADKVNAILNCHLAAGRIGTPGCGPFSATGQPNAMGGREVGGLANMLACHLDLENPDHRAAVKTYWNAPAVIPDAAGHKAVDMFNAVADGRIKALWVMHTNPAVTLPDANHVRDAIENCPFVVVSDITDQTDTARIADVVLPASGWAEKDGTVTNSDRTISRQRGVLTAFGQARPDWWHLAEVGKRMGWKDAFDYTGPADIFREYAALSQIAGGFNKDFDISALKDITTDDYNAMAPTRWPVSASKQGGRFFADGQFFHADGKAKLLPVSHRAPAALPTPDAPFVLNTGRNRDQWHTMTRTALSPRLSAHLAEPYLDIHPSDAADLGITAADLITVSSDKGQSILRARITDAVRKGHVFAPIHWTGETAPTGRIDAVIAGNVDPVSGQPETKAMPVALERLDAAWYGFAVSQKPLRPNVAYWAQARTTAGVRMELAGTTPVADWETFARDLFDLPDSDVSSVIDPNRGGARIVFSTNGQCLAALFTSRSPIAVSRDYLATTLGTPPLPILTGRPPVDQPDPGPVVCSCFNVGLNTILSAIEGQNLVSVESIGAALQAGTNCGSCRPELTDILRSANVKEAAE
ncbi:nitrate reductase [Octadecabacter sp.]|nr:nitrate reductase [Octadecabacter sp.]